MKKNSGLILNIAAVIGLYVFSSVGVFESSAVQRCIEAWPEISVSVVRIMVTLPTLVSIPVMLALSAVPESKLHFRPLMLAGTLLGIIFGIIPYFYAPSFGFILFCRTVIGIASGIIGLRGTLMVRSVPDELRSRYIGYGQAGLYAGSLIAYPVSGILADIHWNYSFLINLMGVPVLILAALFLKEPEKVTVSEADRKPDQDDAGGVRTISYAAILILLMQFFATVSKYALITGMSTLLSVRGLGNALAAGLMISMYSVGAVLSGTFLVKIRKLTGKCTYSISLITVGITLFLVFLSHSIIGIAACSLLNGAAFNTFFSLNQVYIPELVPRKHTAIFLTLIIAFNNSGIFFSGFFINLCHSVIRMSMDVESALLGGAFCFFIYGIFAFAAGLNDPAGSGDPGSGISERIRSKHGEPGLKGS